MLELGHAQSGPQVLTQETAVQPGNLTLLQTSLVDCLIPPDAGTNAGD